MRLITTLETPGKVTNWLETCGHLNNCKDELIKEK